MKFSKLLSFVLSGAMICSGLFSVPASTFKVSAASEKSRVSVHDPSVLMDDNTGKYYIFGSHIEAAVSDDLRNWTRFSNGYDKYSNKLFGNLSQNLSKAFEWAGEDLEDCAGGYAVWAPDVVYNPEYINTDGTKGAYMMYFCTSSTYMRSCIAYAVSKTAEGPYTFADTLIYSGFTANDSYAVSATKRVNRKYTSTNIDELISSGEVTYNNSWFSSDNFNNTLFPNAIDPTIYYDTSGKMYMCYGSWSGGIFTLQIDPATGKCIHPKTGTTSDGRMIDSYFGTKISGGYKKSGEGPFIEYNAATGFYYLWVTYGGLTATGGYNMRVFRSENPCGPFSDPSGKSAVLALGTNLDSTGLKVMGNYKFSTTDTAYMAEGHNSVLKDDDGKWYLVYHTRFNSGSEYHEVRVHSMYFNSEGWPVVSPYEYSGDVISETGYDETDIAGTYEFINHGSDTSSAIHEYSKITLNEDGTITGGAQGTWSESGDSAEAVIVTGGKRYTGYFMTSREEDVSGKTVMTFSAVSSDNQTVWGVKTTGFSGKDRDKKLDYTNINSSLVYNALTANKSESAVKIGDTQLLSGVSYYITNKNSNMVLDVKDGNTMDHTNICQWTKTGGKHQEWRIIALEDGYCVIVSLADEGKCIAVQKNSADDGVNIELQTFENTDNQKWKLIRNGSSYAVVSKCSGDKAGMDIYEWSTENGGNLNQWNYWGGDCQLWYIEPVYPSVNEGVYSIKNISSGKWINDNSSNAVQSDKIQAWKFERLTDNTYVIKKASGSALTVEGSSNMDGADITVSPYKGDDSQIFKIICNKDGSYSFLTKSSGFTSCLDVYEISTLDQAKICQWNFWNGDGQKFIIEACSQEKIKGDANADGTLSVKDAAALIRFLISGVEPEGWTEADINDDSNVNILDFILLKNLLMQ
ncbi:MAG: RICIN domain-containing protein [Oscillospiraceae bacterium]|nr:RICIN domain-containing protein [Oscillospiraceae bacterium]